MVFKINISHKGKTIKKELDSEALIGKMMGESFNGSLVAAELSGYELEITGTSDKAGFPGKKDVEGPELKRVLLTRGFGMKTKPKGLSKKPKSLNKGLRMKRTVRGNTISLDTIQVNTVVKKEGSTKFEDLLPKKEVPVEEVKTEENKVEEVKEEKPVEEVKEDKPEPKPEIKEEVKETPAEEKPEVKEEPTESQ